MVKTKKLIIVGDSAFAEVAHEYFDADSEYEVVAFSVEQAFLKNQEMRGLPVVSFESLETRFDPNTHEIYVAVVYTQLNRLRSRLAQAAKTKGFRLASYVSSRAFVWRNVKIGEHCFIFEDNTVQPFVCIGDNVVLWSGNHIGHHSKIGSNCFISSHVVISGFCDIGENCFIGVNAAIANNVDIGRDNWIGPSSTIMKNTEAGALFVTKQSEMAKVSAPRFFKLRD
ncbi:sugar O-acyltransferase, sialic acid O-acetyltransferase NeuD family [Rhodoferax sp. OV413]|uniref:acetyltransferase n=1 Tax=Rhodoferax sp. OV413 TaxID=1855285 RepID=UPI00088D8FB4|nr:acetyltransferase [Rhodoferax sp. OV413]SDP44687.1 sugar O-acyltransferase, sialic acid O-acetyltransferase NeuD family [Rhodoferax sp. OV413]